MSSTSLLTELDAVNIMLATIGESPVNSLNISGLGDVAVAQSTLSEISRTVQERGWAFNSDNEYTLALTAANEILVPVNAVRIRCSAIDSMSGYVTTRAGKFYNKKTQSFTFDSPLKVDVVWLLDFSEIPEAAKYYITIRAARVFQRRMVTADALERYTAIDEAQALASLQDAELDTNEYNMLKGNPECAYIYYR